MNKDFTFEADEDFAAAAMPVSSQSPWEFSAYSHTVAEEHFQRRTTSIDDKILRAKARKQQYKLPRNAPPKTKDHADTENGVDDNSHDEGAAYIYKKEDSIVEDEQLRQNDKDDAAQISQKYAGDFESGDEQKDDSDEEEASTKAKKSKKSSPKGPTNTLKKVKRRLENGTKQGVPPAKFFSSDEGASFSAKTFLELNLSRPLLRACDALGYKQPTPIQAACIPLALTGRDICGSAVTGSGKTAAFSLPLLERLLFRPRRIPATRVLILTPTRELAVQIHSMIEKLSQYTDIRCCLVVGGLSSKVQEVGLRSYPEIVVATPGRMIDHLHNTHSVGLEDLAILILDEADRLLELGFSNEIQELVRLCPRKRQTMLFSATMTEEVNELVKLSLANPVRLSADPSTQRPATLLEEVVRIRPQHEGDKEAVLLALCSRSFKSKVIIFSGTKMEAHRLKILFGLSGLKAAELHGNLTQAQRLDALELFKEREVDFLIATDVAARGLDIVGVETVVNFECPRDITMYVHRVGRTARAGQQGCAVTFVSDKDHSLLKLVAKRAGSKLSSRIVPVSAILKWHDKIVDMESSVRAVISEEREERILRKAEMEANKAQNLMDYESEIFSRPQKVWFQTSRERRQCAMAAKAAKIAVGNGQKTSRSGVFKDSSSDKSSRKRSLEREKNMTRKKRRRLEAAHEAAEGISDGECSRSKAQNDRGKTASKLRSTTVAEFAYGRAKAVKALDKARESGKLRKTQTIVNKDRSKPRREKQRRAHMKDLFQGDMNKPKENVHKAVKAGRRPGISKRSFKSKARYKRR